MFISLMDIYIILSITLIITKIAFVFLHSLFFIICFSVAGDDADHHHPVGAAAGLYDRGCAGVSQVVWLGLTRFDL